MTYQVRLMPQAAADLRRLDKPVAQRVLSRIKWLTENLESITPEMLTGDWRGLFKLRVGSYRVVYTVSREDRLIMVHHIGHRREIYKIP